MKIVFFTDHFVPEISDLTGNVASLTTSSWHPEFGVEIPNKILELQFEQPQLDIVFSWSKD
ncbi:hypothetical protein OAQ69_04160 [Gammaproteobacteria bacterium]|nr:hypothetical protein [Gammaproteobacteria bacterium]